MLEAIDTTFLSNLLNFGLLIFEGMYFLYAFIIIRQVDHMNKAFQTPAGVLLKVFALAHFAATGLLLFMTVSALVM